ncbi:MAG: hypothetical protein N3D81_02695 [Spirochaetes bacterium]|nr:hypothetical protein [Spirochaetota bacterium]
MPTLFQQEGMVCRKLLSEKKSKLRFAEKNVASRNSYVYNIVVY